MPRLMTIILFASISSFVIAEGFYPLKSEHLDGCGLIATRNRVIYAETGNENFLWIRLNANDERASLVSSRGELVKIGDSKVYVYKLKNETEIKMQMKLVGYCGEVNNKNEDCELFNLGVTLTSGKKKQHLIAEYGC
jgi:hypothetical protein